jgi:CRISPR-associated protein (TIGR02584 family)
MQTEIKNILLCVAGGTPQVITETLYALTQARGERVDEVLVITTPVGKERVMKNLLDAGEGKFFQFCRDYGIAPSSLKFDESRVILLGSDTGCVMEDLVTEEQNRAATDHICRIVRALTGDQATRIHASVGGGRKTMGIALTMAMQLFGRRQDSLSHVLVNPEYESHPAFYYPRPEGPSLTYGWGERKGEPIQSAPWVSLSEIPFIRLGGMLSAWLGGTALDYSGLVSKAMAQAQAELDLQMGKLRLHLAEERVSIAGSSAGLPDRQFFVYVLLALARRREPQDGFLKLQELRREHLEEAAQLIAPLRNPGSFAPGEPITLEAAQDLPGYGFIKTLAGYIAHGDLAALERDFNQIKSKVENLLLPQKLPLIQKRGRRATAAFRLNIEPARIEFD